MTLKRVLISDLALTVGVPNIKVTSKNIRVTGKSQAVHELIQRLQSARRHKTIVYRSLS
jgi:hypothetical protein